MILNERDIIRRLTASDRDRRLTITPILDPKSQFQPSSVDLRLGTQFVVVKNSRLAALDPLRNPADAAKEAVGYVDYTHAQPYEKFVLHPGEFALASTLEYVKLPTDLAGRLEGKSTWGRVGLQIHSTAGFVDPGFEGNLTFELQNVGRVPIPLYPTMRVAQICFYEGRPTMIPYQSKASAFYAGQAGLMTSRYYEMSDFRVLRKIVPEVPRS